MPGRGSKEVYHEPPEKVEPQAETLEKPGGRKTFVLLRLTEWPGIIGDWARKDFKKFLTGDQKR